MILSGSAKESFRVESIRPCSVRTTCREEPKAEKRERQSAGLHSGQESNFPNALIRSKATRWPTYASKPWLKARHGWTRERIPSSMRTSVHRCYPGNRKQACLIFRQGHRVARWTWNFVHNHGLIHDNRSVLGPIDYYHFDFNYTSVEKSWNEYYYLYRNRWIRTVCSIISV